MGGTTGSDWGCQGTISEGGSCSTIKAVRFTTCDKTRSENSCPRAVILFSGSFSIVLFVVRFPPWKEKVHYFLFPESLLRIVHPVGKKTFFGGGCSPLCSSIVAHPPDLLGGQAVTIQFLWKIAGGVSFFPSLRDFGQCSNTFGGVGWIGFGAVFTTAGNSASERKVVEPSS